MSCKSAEIDRAEEEIDINTEHQSTLWHATPFAMIFLLMIFDRSATSITISQTNEHLITNLLDLFIRVEKTSEWWTV